MVKTEHTIFIKKIDWIQYFVSLILKLLSLVQPHLFISNQPILVNNYSTVRYDPPSACKILFSHCLFNFLFLVVADRRPAVTVVPLYDTNTPCSVIVYSIMMIQSDITYFVTYYIPVVFSSGNMGNRHIEIIQICQWDIKA